MRRPQSGDEYGDRISDLRYEREMTTRDVADFLRVTQASVRSPKRQERSSNVFDSHDVFAAFELIAARRKATGHTPRSEGYVAGSSPADRIPPKHYDVIITTSEAARLVQVSPATIRSWIHRGHLTPASSSTPRAVRLRVEDVVNAARARKLSQPVAGFSRGSRAR